MARTSVPAARPGYSRWIWSMVATLLLLAGLSGCGGESPAPTTTEELRSDRDRDNSPSATRADLRELVQGNNDFAFDLYRALRDGEGNLFYSPFSISQALAMTFAGAGGETERQMADTLQYQLPQSSLHPAFNALDRTLASRGKDPRGTQNQEEAKEYFRLNIANAVWGQHGYGFLPDFLDVLAENNVAFTHSQNLCRLIH